jgi:hypothetical protein
VTVQGRAAFGTPSALTVRTVLTANGPTAVTVTVRAAGQRCVTRLDLLTGPVDTLLRDWLRERAGQPGDPRFGAVARMMRAPWWSQPRAANSAPYVISASMISVAADCRYARLPGVLAGAELGARAGDPPFSVQNMLNVTRIVQQRCFGATVQSRQVAPALPVGVGVGG